MIRLEQHRQRRIDCGLGGSRQLGAVATFVWQARSRLLDLLGTALASAAATAMAVAVVVALVLVLASVAND